MNGTALPAINGWFVLPSIDGKSRKRTIATYAEVLIHLLRRYATDAVFEKAVECSKL